MRALPARCAASEKTGIAWRALRALAALAFPGILGLAVLVDGPWNAAILFLRCAALREAAALHREHDTVRAAAKRC